MKSGIKKSLRMRALILIIPALIYFLIFAIYPMIENVVLTFETQNSSGAYVFAGLKNYYLLFNTPHLGQIVYNSLLYTFVVPVVDVLFSIPLANFLKNLKKSYLFPLILLPSFVPLVTGATMWILMLNPLYGISYYILKMDLFTSVWSIIIIDIWSSMPLATVMIYSGLNGIPKSIDEAAYMDGITGLKKLVNIDLPYVKYQILAAFVLMLIYGSFTFDPIYASLSLSPPFATTDLSFFSYQLFFTGNIGFSAVLMTIMSIVSTVIAVIFVKLTLSSSKSSGRIRFKRLPNSMMPLKLQWLFTIIYIVFFLIPFIWLVLESIKTNAEIFYIPPLIIPKIVTAQHYLSSITKGAPYYITSLVVSILGSILALLIGTPAAYSVARHRVGGLKFIGLVLFIYSIPLVILMIPDYAILNSIHTINSWLGLIIVYPVMVMPIVIWMLYNFYIGFPRYYDEASYMDGMGFYKSFFKTIIPLSYDGIFVAFLYAFIFAWGALIFPLAFTYSPYNMSILSPAGAQTLTIFIGSSIGHEAIDYGLLSAASVLSIIPAIIISILVRSKLDKVWRGSGIK